MEEKPKIHVEKSIQGSQWAPVEKYKCDPRWNNDQFIQAIRTKQGIPEAKIDNSPNHGSGWMGKK